ncbi:RNA polymerase sigma-70 factor (ECF subfamily) [Streptomyces sp. SAI-117]|uniref:sigma-70 family RNA polymerase sigma factor n=1 Tax=unclassified Streptomyces TaxID=2593676 RepID=UPI0024739836|nr:MULTISPECIES: sigma-70 family RNA polymerase sigma factor [unclassified Streptomyces]MDH6554021.1 RNA polymerase sigma-70 factor (ECF subfamily) [Streptomyces sp. SAI-041]MDH6573097.1 RNA polymerase sigma-70 factor (ECF subfamily) [Streptomyces sp. SAI-117]MDH6581941.1 RNA polymerase sigma-70 factor (ECF subfamily) [Streptomyces sp. SAI-133]
MSLVRSAGLPVPPTAERHRARLLRHAKRLTSGDLHRAEDIVQETMLRAWLTDLDAYDEERRLAWLLRVARNLAVDAHRRERAVPVGVLPEDMLHRPDGAGDLADAVVDRQVVRWALARLSLEHREVLFHVHLRDRTRAEAARVIGVPQGTVKSRNHYALEAMRREIPAA